MVIYRDVQKVVKLRGWIHTPRCLCPKPLYTPNDKGLLDRHDVVLHHPSTDKGCQSKKVKTSKFKLGSKQKNALSARQFTNSCTLFLLEFVDEQLFASHLTKSSARHMLHIYQVYSVVPSMFAKLTNNPFLR